MKRVTGIGGLFFKCNDPEKVKQWYKENLGLPVDDWCASFEWRDKEELLKVLAEEGVEIVGEVEEYEYGKFGWIMDPEGNKIELWEPVDDKLQP